MKDYREVIESLNLIRGTKSATKWIMEITKLECDVATSEYIEYKPYFTIICLKKELICRTGAIPHKFIRSFIKKQIETYDEEYIAKVGHLFSIISTYELDESNNDNTLLAEIKKCFKF